MAKRFSEEEQKAVVKRAAQGEKVSDLAKEMGFAPTTFPKWKAKWGTVNHRVKLKVTNKKKTTTPRKNPLLERARQAEADRDFWKEQYEEVFIQLRRLESGS